MEYVAKQGTTALGIIGKRLAGWLWLADPCWPRTAGVLRTANAARTRLDFAKCAKVRFSLVAFPASICTAYDVQSCSHFFLG